MSRHNTDNLRAATNHAQRVLATAHGPREARVDLSLPAEIANRLGLDLAERFEALVGIAVAAAEMIDLRRERDRLIALNRPDRAQPLGGRLAVAEQTVKDLVAAVAGPGQQRGSATPDHRPGRLKDRADARARELAPVYAQALATGCETDRQVADFFNDRGVPSTSAASAGFWTAEAAAALRRRLTRLGLARLALDLRRPIVVRNVRTRTRPSVPTVPNRDIAVPTS